MPNCKDSIDQKEHLFAHSRNESVWYRSSRYQTTYVSVDYYYCQHCLAEETKRKSVTINDGDLHALPDWARHIKTHGIDSHY